MTNLIGCVLSIWCDMLFAEICRSKVMPMRKLVIADYMQGFSASLAKALSHDYEVHTCSDGDTALEMLKVFRPEVLIINLALPYTDGLTVLQETSYLPPTVLALTSLNQPFVWQSAIDAGAQQVLLIPTSTRWVISQLNQLLKAQPLPPSPQKIVRGFLDEMGFPEDRVAYKDMYVGIPIFAQDTDQSLHKEVYPAIVALCGRKSVTAVEGAIRKLIGDVWAHRDQAVWEEFFPGFTEAPCIRDFFKALAKKLNDE